MKKLASEMHETRKLQITGGSTYIISLPKKWVAEMNLEKGSLLTLTKKSDGTLIITPEELPTTSEPLETKIIISQTDNPETVVRKIVSAYLVGYNLISVKTKSQRLSSIQRKVIKSFTRRMLVGTEVIADSVNEIVLKVLLSYPELSVQSAIRRICIITSSMHKDALSALKNFDKELALDITTMDDEVDRFSLYVIRQLKAAVQNERILTEIGLASGRDCLGYRLVTKAIERAADHAVEIAENISSLRNPVTARVLELIDAMSTSATSVFNDSVEALLKRSYKVAENVVQEAKNVALREKELMPYIMKIGDVQEVSSLRLIVESVKRTAEYASDVAEIVLNMTIKSVLKEGLTR
jgi:phosphate uptake regulator